MIATIIMGVVEKSLLYCTSSNTQLYHYHFRSGAEKIAYQHIICQHAGHTQRHTHIRSSLHDFNCNHIRTACVCLRSISSHTGIIPNVYPSQTLPPILPTPRPPAYIFFLFSPPSIPPHTHTHHTVIGLSLSC